MITKNLIVTNLIHYFVRKIFLIEEYEFVRLFVNHLMINQKFLKILNEDF